MRMADWADWANWKAMRKYVDRDLLLKRAGLETRSPSGDFFTGLGLFSIGLLVGAGLGMMFAPKRGEEMRTMLGDAWKNRRGAQDFQGTHLGAEAGLPPAPSH